MPSGASPTALDALEPAALVVETSPVHPLPGMWGHAGHPLASIMRAALIFDSLNEDTW